MGCGLPLDVLAGEQYGVILTSEPEIYLADARWLAAFGDVSRVEDEDWGMVQAKRVYYADGLEAEVGITAPEWAWTEPVDPGTARVVRDGMRVLYDRSGLLRSLLAAVWGEHLR